MTAGIVNIQGQAATYAFEVLRRNVPDGKAFRTEVRIKLNTTSTIGELRIGVFGKHIIEADAHPYDSQGPMQIQLGRGPGVQEGTYVITIQSAYRGYTLVVLTSEPEELTFKAFQV